MAHARNQPSPGVVGHLPRRLVPFLFLIVTVATGSFLFGWMAMAFLEGVGPVVGVCTSVLSTLTALGCCYCSESARSAWLKCLVFCIGAAVLNTPISLVACVATEVSNFSDRDLDYVVMAAFFGAFYAVPLGSLFGLLYSIPVRAAYQGRHNDALDRIDRLCLCCGRWLALVGLGTLALCVVMSPMRAHSDSAWLFCGTAAVLGGLTWFRGHKRIKACRRWLDDVRRGLRFDLELIPLDEKLVGASQVPRLFAGTGRCDGLVVRRAQVAAKDGAYRSSTCLLPMVRVEMG